MTLHRQNSSVSSLHHPFLSDLNRLYEPRVDRKNIYEITQNIHGLLLRRQYTPMPFKIVLCRPTNGQDSDQEDVTKERVLYCC